MNHRRKHKKKFTFWSCGRKGCMIDRAWSETTNGIDRYPGNHWKKLGQYPRYLHKNLLTKDYEHVVDLPS